jgi:hypothetical protein
MYSVKILSQHYHKPQTNINFLLHTAQETGNDLKIMGSHSGANEDSSLHRCYNVSKQLFTYNNSTTQSHIWFNTNSIIIMPFNFTQHKYILTECTQDTGH